MNILYVSCLCSERFMHELFETAIEKPHPAPQKYHSLLVDGLKENGQKVTCLVAPPVTLRSHPHKRWWKKMVEEVDGVRYVYMPFYNHPIPKLLGFKIYAFFYTLAWIFLTHGEKAMICDVLNAHAFASMRACLLTHTKTVGIITDIPGMIGEQIKKSWFFKWEIKHSLRNIRRFTHFIPLTEAMNDIFNPDRKKPYVVIEGLSDFKMVDKDPTPSRDGKRHITYTGTLEARYGVKTMIEAFMLLPQDDLILDVFGKGPMEEDMLEYVMKDNRIHYHGMVPVEQAVRAQQSSYLLVNPRPSKEEFTKYSFPSKNMEYMSTGVALLTAVLPGMPVEYHPNLFLFEDESVDGLSERLDEILNMSEEKVKEKGLKGKHFVMEKKNNIRQAEKVLEMIKGVQGAFRSPIIKNTDRNFR